MGSSKAKDNVIELPLASRALEDAALWIARLDKGLDDKQREQLGEWLARHPDHVSALFELAELWDELNLLAELAEFAPRAQRPRGNWRHGWRAVAAVLVVAIGFGSLFPVLRTSPDPGTLAATTFMRTYTTAIGEQASESLPDGSLISLNTNTEVEVNYQESERIVVLRRGEAHFTVAHDTTRPFGVRAGEHIVQAVGTAFNVRIQDAGDVEVMVTDGIVRILDTDTVQSRADASDPVDWWAQSVQRTGLVQGQAAVLREPPPGVNGTPQVLRLEPAELEMKLAWQSGVLIFEGETLAVVLDEFARYTTTTFMIGDAALAGQRIGGIYEVGDTENLLLSLKENFHINAQQLADDRFLLLPDEETADRR